MPALQNPRPLHPYPASVDWGDEFIVIRKDIEVCLTGPVSDLCKKTFAEYWQGFSCSLGSVIFKEEQGGALSFYMSVNEKMPELPTLSGGDTYALTVDKDGVAAIADSEASLAHAWITFLQLVNPRSLAAGDESFSAPCVTIKDSPALAFRGIHLCVFPETSLTRLERMVRMAALMKYSHIVLEFWGMLKLDAMSELAWPQAYSKEQVKPIIDAANGMGVQVIPMINHWGHASSSRSVYGRHVVLDQNPRHALLFEPDGWTWCMSNPDTLKLLADVRRELIDFAGEGDYFHIGCDEAYSHATCDLCRNTDTVRLFADYVNSVAADLKSLGRRAIMWGDALLAEGEWPKPTIATSRADQKTHMALEHLDRDIIIADWQYYITEENIPSLEYFEEKGFDVAISPWHDLENIKSLGKAAVKRGSFGFLQTTWHTLPDKIRMLLLGGAAGWLADGSTYDLDQYHPLAYQTLIADYMRKVLPVNGDYSKAGWNNFEVVG